MLLGLLAALPLGASLAASCLLGVPDTEEEEEEEDEDEEEGGSEEEETDDDEEEYTDDDEEDYEEEGASEEEDDELQPPQVGGSRQGRPWRACAGTADPGMLCKVGWRL